MSQTTAKTQWWLTLGLGSCSTFADEGPFANGIVATVEDVHALYQARYLIGYGSSAGLSPHSTYQDLGLLYGYGLHDSSWFANASAGLCYVRFHDQVVATPGSGVAPRSVSLTSSDGLGAAWQLQLFGKFSNSSFLGLGLTIGGEVSRLRPVVTYLLTLEAGRF